MESERAACSIEYTDWRQLNSQVHSLRNQYPIRRRRKSKTLLWDTQRELIDDDDEGIIIAGILSESGSIKCEAGEQVNRGRRRGVGMQAGQRKTLWGNRVYPDRDPGHAQEGAGTTSGCEVAPSINIVPSSRQRHIKPRVVKSSRKRGLLFLPHLHLLQCLCSIQDESIDFIGSRFEF